MHLSTLPLYYRLFTGHTELCVLVDMLCWLLHTLLPSFSADIYRLHQWGPLYFASSWVQPGDISILSRDKEGDKRT